MDTDALALEEGQYLSLAQDAVFEQTIQRSRFVACVRSATSRASFDDTLKEIMMEYPKANHYCWAYRFYGQPYLEHASDAGEPAGTAGRPILGALKKFNLANTMAVVIRYYGGVKLGVKGLIAAYGGTTIQAIESSVVQIREPMTLVRFTCAYDLYNILLSKFERLKLDVDNLKSSFSDIISGEIIIPTSKTPIVIQELDKLSPIKEFFRYELHSL